MSLCLLDKVSISFFILRRNPVGPNQQEGLQGELEREGGASRTRTAYTSASLQTPLFYQPPTTCVFKSCPLWCFILSSLFATFKPPKAVQLLKSSKTSKCVPGILLLAFLENIYEGFFYSQNNKRSFFEVAEILR